MDRAERIWTQLREIGMWFQGSYNNVQRPGTGARMSQMRRNLMALQENGRRCCKDLD